MARVPLAAATTRPQKGVTVTLALLAPVVSLLAGVLLYAATGPTSRLRGPALTLATAAALGAYAVLLAVRPACLVLSNLVVLAVALVTGSALGSLLAGRPGLVSFCITAAVMDLLSSRSGATARIVDGYRRGASDLLLYLSLSAPVGGKPRPIVGIGDLLVLTCLYVALRRLGLGGARALWAPLSGLLLAVAVGLAVGGAPALPFVAATTVAFVLTADLGADREAGQASATSADRP